MSDLVPMVIVTDGKEFRGKGYLTITDGYTHAELVEVESVRAASEKCEASP